MAKDRLMVGVSGIRGTVGETLTPQVARDFGYAFGEMVGAGATVTMARDTRPSGPMIRSAVSVGLLGSGVSVVDLGVVSTPGASLMTRRLGQAPAGAKTSCIKAPQKLKARRFALTCKVKAGEVPSG